MVSGVAGVPTRPVYPRAGSVAVRLEPHYVILDVERAHIGLRAVNLLGVTFDWAVIVPRNAAAPR